jgi:RsmE family RNA methyltransferase
MKITPISSLSQCVPGLRFWCDEAAYQEELSLLEILAKLPYPRDAVHLCIGPEGGWDPQERDLLKKIGTRVHLGSLTLRAETAALKATSLLSSWLERK